jgi:hypothetical protein
MNFDNLSVWMNFLIVFLSVIVLFFAVSVIFKLGFKKESTVKSIFNSSFILISIGYSFWVLAELFWFIFDIIDISQSLSFIEYFYILGYFFYIAGFGYFLSTLCFSKNGDKTISCTKKATILFLISSFVYVLFENYLNGSFFEDLSLFQLVLNFAYPILTILLVILTFLLYSTFKNEKLFEKLFFLIFLGFLFSLIGDILYNYYILRDIYGIFGFLSDLCYSLQYVFAGFACYLLNKSLALELNNKENKK